MDTKYGCKLHRVMVRQLICYDQKAENVGKLFNFVTWYKGMKVEILTEFD